MYYRRTGLGIRVFNASEFSGPFLENRGISGAVPAALPLRQREKRRVSMNAEKRKENREIRSLFLKYVLKYLLVLVIVLAASFLVVVRVYQITERNILDENTWKLERGVDELEDQMLRMDDMAETVREARGIRYLEKLEGKLGIENYVELNDVRDQLQNATIMSDFAEMSFVLFKNNQCFVSESQSSDSFTDYYGTFLEAEGMNADEFRKIIFSFEKKVNFFSCPELHYSKYNKMETETNPLFCVVYPSEGEIRNFSGEDASMAVVFVVRLETILNIMAADSTMDEVAFTLRYYNNDPFFYYDGMSRDKESGRGGSIRVSATGMGGILHVDASFSQYSLYRYVLELTGILLIYLVIGFAAAVLLAFFFAGKQYRNMQGLIFSVVPPEQGSGRIRNEFDLLEDFIQQLSRNRDKYRTKVALLENQMKNSMLEYAFSQGLYTEESRKRFSQVFPVPIEYFCIGILEIQTEEPELRLQISMRAREWLGQLLGTRRNFFSVLSGNGQEIYLILLESSEASDTGKIADVIRKTEEKLSREYQMNFCAGLSSVGVGIENTKRCYNQALEALMTYEGTEKNIVATWYMLKQRSSVQAPVNLEVMQKLQQFILYGESSAAGELFDHLYDQYRRNVAAFEMRKEEIIYSVRNILTGLLEQQIFENSSVRIPEFGRDQNFEDMLAVLKEGAVEMCREVESKKNGRTENLKKKILDYLNDNYTDASLTAVKISSETGVSEKRLYQLVKEATGCTLAEYVELIRVQYACQLLVTTQLSNVEIAERVGFGHVNTFYRVFAKREGISPAKYRKNFLE